MRKILVATDFSPAADRAVQVAARLARQANAALRVVHVVPPRRRLATLWHVDLATALTAHRRAAVALRRVADSIVPSSRLEVSTGLVSGAASVQIARAVREYGADLLVIGAAGEHVRRLRQFPAGGTASKLIDRASVPLLLVRTIDAAEGLVLAAVDLSPASGDVVAWARAVAAEDERVTVLHVHEAPDPARLEAYGIATDTIGVADEEEQRRRSRELDSLISSAGVRRIVGHGDPIDRIFDFIEESKPTLVVLGRRRKRPGRRGGPTDSVSRHVAMFAPSNVLLAAPGATPTVSSPGATAP